MKNILSSLIFVSVMLFTQQLAAQTKSKPVLDHSVYDNWKSISKLSVTEKGNYAYYTIAPQAGDRVFVIYRLDNRKEQRFDRFELSKISYNEKWALGLIKPTYQQLREAKINKERKRGNSETPKDTLAIINIQTGEIQKYPNHKSNAVSPLFNTDYVAFMLTPDKKSKSSKNSLKNSVEEASKGVEETPSKSTAKTASKEPANAPAATPADTSGTAKGDLKPKTEPENSLFVLNFSTGKIDTIKRVNRYNFMRNGMLSYTTLPPEKSKSKSKQKDSTTAVAEVKVGSSEIGEMAVTKTDLREDLDTMRFGLFLYNPESGKKREILSGRRGAEINLPVRNTETGNYLILARLDTTKSAKDRYAVYLFNGSGKAFKIADSTSAGLPEGWIIGKDSKIGFSRNGKRAYFGISPKPVEKDTTKYDFERAQLDIWSWDADYNQPRQLVNLHKDMKKTYSAYLDLTQVDPGNMLRINQLADEKFENVYVTQKFGDSDYSLIRYDKPYRIQTQWNIVPLSDYYILNIKTGEKRLVAEGSNISFDIKQPVESSYRVGYNMADSSWVALNLETGEFRNLTKEIPSDFYDDSNDQPMPAYPYEGVEYLSDNTVLIPDKYDLWQVDLDGKRSPVNFTKGVGRVNNRVLRVLNLAKDTSEFKTGSIDIHKPIFLSSFNKITKECGLYELTAADKSYSNGSKLKLLTEQKNRVSAILSNNSKRPVFVYSKGNFESGLNVWVSPDKFKTERQISDINPQQRDYNWGTVELFKWKTADSIDSEGLLFKPEDFDSTKSYPLMIYFYEKYSDDLYSPRVPAPSRSTVNIPMFVSNGYIVFIPDLYYKDGHPGKSAMRSLMPAVEKLEKECSWIDGSRMAIQGQSWGGYQVAYIITQTDKFAAAGAGAPVSNMTSAYGGIRWGTGRTRQFQYEQTQSRIGDNLWDGFDLYVENSPLFFAPAVKTPVLIMHNDKDEAVPWYQGIEFFTGLRRLGKRAWLLQYNNESHNLGERRNAKDLSVRLQQFFDHYLKGEPAPKWMTPHGRPAIEKGLND